MKTASKLSSSNGCGWQAGQAHHKGHRTHQATEQGECTMHLPVLAAQRGFGPGPSQQVQRQQGQGGAVVEQASDAQR